MFVRPLLFAAALTLIGLSTSHASDLNQRIEAYLANFKDESGYQPLISGLALDYERLQHNMKKEPQFDWSISVAIEPNGRYAMGFGKDTPSGAGPTRYSKRFCNQQRKIRSMKAKCRTFAINEKIQKPYKR